jgi:hypothetical protein
MYFNSSTPNASATHYLTGSISNTNSTISVFVVCAINTATSGTNARCIGFAATTNDWDTLSSFGFNRERTTTGMNPVRNIYLLTTLQPGTPSLVPNLYERWFDGSKVFTSVNGNTPVSANSSGAFAITKFAIGTDTGRLAAGQFGGYISEILVYNTSLANSDRQAVEGYLAWKWNLQDKLPNSHPYKTSSPVQ